MIFLVPKNLILGTFSYFFEKINRKIKNFKKVLKLVDTNILT